MVVMALLLRSSDFIVEVKDKSPAAINEIWLLARDKEVTWVNLVIPVGTRVSWLLAKFKMSNGVVADILPMIVFMLSRLICLFKQLRVRVVLLACVGPQVQGAMSDA